MPLHSSLTELIQTKNADKQIRFEDSSPTHQMAFITAAAIHHSQLRHRPTPQICNNCPKITMTTDADSPSRPITNMPTLHIETPLIPSATPYLSRPATSKKKAPKILLKMDSLQPGGSFKIRGHGHLLATHASAGKRLFISSSGGNAGMAVALAASRLNVSATIVLPSSTPTFMQRRLERAGAHVIVHGDVWNEADAYARSLVSEKDAVYVSPFDDKLLWQGHSSLVHELVKQCNGKIPGKIIVSVGGGGLLLGMVEGLRQVGWLNDVQVVAAETEGAQSFAKMLEHKKIVQLKEISSIAKSLGALAVSDDCLRVVEERMCDIRSVVVSDKEAVEACSAMAVHHRVLVEPACGAAIAATRKIVMMEDGGDMDENRPLVVVVCGGSMTSPALLADWIESTGATEQDLS